MRQVHSKHPSRKLSGRSKSGSIKVAKGKKKKKINHQPNHQLDCQGVQYIGKGVQYIGIGKISLMCGLGDLGKW